MENYILSVRMERTGRSSKESIDMQHLLLCRHGTGQAQHQRCQERKHQLHRSRPGAKARRPTTAKTCSDATKHHRMRCKRNPPPVSHSSPQTVVTDY